MAATLCITVSKNPSEHHLEILVKNLLRQCDQHRTWRELLRDICEANNIEVHEDWHVTVGCSSTSNGEVFHPELDQPISTAIEFASVRYVNFVLKDGELLPQSDGHRSRRNAFTVLMEASTLPVLIPRKALSESSTAKDRLYNDVADDLEKDGALFNTSTSDQMYHVSNIVNTLWYLDGNKHKIQERAKTSTEVKPLPERFYNHFNGYNDWKKKRKKAPRLDCSSLKSYAEALFHMLSRPFSSSWSPSLYDSLQGLALALGTYGEYLNRTLKLQTNRQNLLHPARQISEHCWIRHHMDLAGIDDNIEDIYSSLDIVMCATNLYEPVFFDEELHTNRPFKNRTERFRFFENIHLSVPVDVLRYDPGGACGVTVFLWRVPREQDPSSMMTTSARIVNSLKGRLPEYHTRRMRKQFTLDYGNISGSRIQPHILRSIYADISLDASVDQNPSLDNRIRQAILAEDPDLATDLRHLNKGRPGDTFDAFFNQLNQQVEDMRAADERRHGVEHMAKFISIRDLIRDVSQDCPPDTKIPSESTVLFAFAPKNAHAAVARLYKQRVDLKFKIQTRQLRCSHQDEHYCAAIFKYIRTYTARFQESCTLLCVDDKAKLHFGEPGLSISSGVRGRQSIVPVSSQLAALDHDVSSKGSLTPSVCLNVQIPNNEADSFYRGEVTVTLKDSIFQASSPFRHGAELIDILKKQPSITPVLLIYSDGGPDHRVNYASVKLVIIAIFHALDLDLIVAARTAPGHSWANPAERIMSVLNLAYQNCSLSRKECCADIEGELKNTNSMDDIRKKSAKNPAIKPAWMESVSDMIQTLNERAAKLTLKDIPFKCGNPADDKTITELESTVINAVDPTIVPGKYTKKDLSKNEAFHAFLQKHCIERSYIFQVAKCDDPTCCKERRGDVKFPWVPDPVVNRQDVGHYLPFDEVVGTVTTEGDRPSIQNESVASVAQDQQGCKNSMLVGQNVRKTVQCYECGKPRCIYSKSKLTVRESRSLSRLLTRHDYSCGAMITPDGDALQGKVFVRLQLSCNKPIEFAYYSSSVDVARPDVCCHCGAGGTEKSTDLSRSYKVVLPVCAECLAMGKDIPKRQPIKT